MPVVAPTNYKMRQSFNAGVDGAAFLEAGSEASGEAFALIDSGDTAKYTTSVVAHGACAFNTNATTNSYLRWKDMDFGVTPWQGTSYLRFYFRLAAAPPATSGLAAGYDSAGGGGAKCFGIDVKTDRVLRQGYASGTDATGTVAIPVNQWVRIEAKIVHQATGVMETRLWLDPTSTGAPDDTITTATSNNFGLDLNQLRIGNIPNQVNNWFLDDVAMGQTDWIGPAPDGEVLDVWVNNTSDTGTSIAVASLDLSLTRIGYSVNPDLSSPSYTSLIAPDANGMTRHELTGLTASTDYYYFVESSTGQQFKDERSVGRFKTFPVPDTQFDFTFAFGSCMTSGGDSEAVQNMNARLPLVSILLGDFHYEDIGTNDPALFRAATRRVMEKGAMRQAMKLTSVDYVYDDHDSGGNGADKNSTSMPAAQTSYRQRTPYYPLPAADSINHTFVIGRVRFIVLDIRSFRDPTVDADGATKSMLGATQLAWLKATLSASTSKVNIIVSPVIWNSVTTDEDTWGSYTYERNDIVSWATANDVLGSLYIISGDMHSLAADDGTNTVGGIPTVNGGPLNNNSNVVKGGATWSEGFFPPGPDTADIRRQYGFMSVTDTGSNIELAFEGYDIVGASTVMTMTTNYAIIPASPDGWSVWEDGAEVAVTGPFEWNGTTEVALTTSIVV